jgi:hypothetical protein
MERVNISWLSDIRDPVFRVLHTVVTNRVANEDVDVQAGGMFVH